MAKLIPGDMSQKRLRSLVKRRQKGAKELTSQADQQIEKLLIRRFDRLVSVKRFMFLWVALFVLLFLATVAQLRALSPYYQSLQPIPGGLYNEGLVGSFTNASPLYASSSADSAVSRLVFSGLLRYDTSNNLTGDLATAWEVTPDGKRYTVHLRKDVRWHDGHPFTVDDVVFTYQTIADIEAQSYLYTSWQGTNVIKQDDYTVIFDLPSQLASFPNALTNGIVPKHLLADIPSGQLRSAGFNTSPVGTGPFEWKLVQVSGVSSTERQQLINLSAYSRYHEGRPRLDGISLITFSDEKQMIQAFQDKRINAMSGLEIVPDELTGQAETEFYATPLTAAVMAFFNNSRPVLGDANVRKALVSGTDRSSMISTSYFPKALLSGPLLRSHLGYDPSITQLPYNSESANHLLDLAGWHRGADGQRFKDGQPLVISLSSQDSTQYTRAAEILQKEWSKLGIRTDVRYYNTDELKGTIIPGHDYDILLYGISLGADPDVFAYWHSSQSSISSQGRLNLSEYRSIAADQALEAGRTRLEPDLRATKYRAFLQIWTNDAPALALYQPNFIYVTRSPVFGYERKSANANSDRFYNVHNWMVRQERQNLL